MADRSSIEWTDATWNPVRAQRLVDGVERIGWHCEHVSEGCRNCYAERFNRRGLGTGLDYKPGHLRTAQRPQGEVQIFLDMKMLLQPLRWRAPRKIFVGSMTDVFADFVTDEMLDRMFAVMALCPQHVFQVPTKRPLRARRWFDRFENVDWLGNLLDLMDELQPGPGPRGSSSFSTWPLPNVWLGTSIEDRAALIERAGHLRKIPAAVRFFSCEPLIGDLGDVVLSDIDWVICGGESGPKARPMHPDWARSLRDQCAAADVPFFFKQWGEWAPYTAVGGIGWSNRTPQRSSYRGPTVGSVLMPSTGYTERAYPTRFADNAIVVRAGKKLTGRLLEGVEHSSFPRVEA